MPRKRADQEHYDGGVATTEGALLAIEPQATLPEEPHTLGDILDDLLAWEETMALAPTDEARAEITSEIATRQANLIAKVDRFAAVMRRLEHEAAWEKAESERHSGRRRRYEAAYQRMEAYAIHHMHEANLRKLEGQGAALKLRPGNGAVVITDEAAVPEEFKTVTVTMPLVQWIELMQAAGLNDPLRYAPQSANASISIPKDPVKKAIKAGREIPGADISFSDSLQLE